MNCDITTCTKKQLTDILKRWISNVATFEKVRENNTEKNSMGEKSTGGKKCGKKTSKGKKYAKKKLRGNSRKKKYGEKSMGEKIREKKYGEKVRSKKNTEKYGKQVRGKSHVTSGDIISGQTCARYHFRLVLIAPPQIRLELCPYATYI